VLEAGGKRIKRGKRSLDGSDAETLWAEIRELARNYDYPFAPESLRSASTSTGR